jgi:hypothetical protein
MSPAQMLIADPGGLGPRHERMAAALYAAGLAAPLGTAPPPPHAPLDETGRVAREIRARGLL